MREREREKGSGKDAVVHRSGKMAEAKAASKRQRMVNDNNTSPFPSHEGSSSTLPQKKRSKMNEKDVRLKPPGSNRNESS